MQKVVFLPLCMPTLKLYPCSYTHILVSNHVHSFLTYIFSFYSLAETSAWLSVRHDSAVFATFADSVLKILHFLPFLRSTESSSVFVGYRLLGRALHKGFPGISTCQFSSSLPSFPSFICRFGVFSTQWLRCRWIPKVFHIHTNTWDAHTLLHRELMALCITYTYINIDMYINLLSVLKFAQHLLNKICW